MGLIEILNGLQNAQRGQQQPAPRSSGQGGGMSPLIMALLALLASKATQGSSGQPQPAPGRSGRAPAPAGGGGLEDLLGGLFGGGAKPGGQPGGGGLGDILGGLLGGGNAGSTLNGGLGNLINDLQRNGQGKAAQSWISKGPNESISPDDLESAVGVDTLDQLIRRSGMPRQELLSGLSQQLPELVDQLTPDGRLPTEQEASRWV